MAKGEVAFVCFWVIPGGAQEPLLALHLGIAPCWHAENRTWVNYMQYKCPNRCTIALLTSCLFVGVSLIFSLIYPCMEGIFGSLIELPKGLQLV